MLHNHTIEKITAREILDSRGYPTVEATIYLNSGIQAKASVPSGASVGSHEVYELRDGDTGRYMGMGVRQACENVNDKISRILKGFDVLRQQDIDKEMVELDGTSNLKKIGANAVLAVSLASARAAALSQGLPLYKYLRKAYNLQLTTYNLPIPLFNIFNGGKHADTNLDFQEFLIIPAGLSQIHADQNADSRRYFKEMVRAGAEIFHVLKEVLLKNGFDTDVGLEGGFAPNIDNTMQALDLIMEAIKSTGYEPNHQIQLGVDVGASVLYDHDRDVYHFGLLDHDMTADQLISLYSDWARDYPFIYLEDGLQEDDWQNWKVLTEEFKYLNEEFIRENCSRDFMIVGDDLFVTHTNRLGTGINEQVANSVIAKPNQAGTLSKAMEFINLAQDNNYQVVISHRSGETNDDFISDLAVAVGADFIKAGSLSRGERLAKYNRLMEIETELAINT